MDVETVKTERQKLAANIGELVNGFQKLTGCTVESIRLQHLVTVVEKAPVKTHVDIEIKID